MYTNSSKKGGFAPAHDQAQAKVAPDGQSSKYTTGGRILTKVNDACIEGISGSFFQVKHDFRPQGLDSSLQGDFKKLKKETAPRDKFRFVVCVLALAGMSVSLMSRTIFNVSIVEMTAKIKPDSPTTPETITEQSIATISPSTVMTLSDVEQKTNEYSTDEQAEEADSAEAYNLHFDWTEGEKQFVISAFYIGYAPSMMLSGGLTDKYGAKYILLMSVVGSTVINLFTPFMARLGIPLLVCSRITLGILQGGLVPATYGLFNKWLTMTEVSIFVPLTRVAFGVGSLIGASLPGVIVYLGYQWPSTFMIAGFLCAVWTLGWYSFASSSPQGNRLVSNQELRWILRKKLMLEPQVNVSVISGTGTGAETVEKKAQKVPPPPFLLIIRNPSVLALTLVKFTYQAGLDFIILEISIYLRAIYNTPTETISAIFSGACLLQLLLVTFVGYSAKVLVNKGAFGLSRTKWRKLFQGASNFLMALIYFGMALVNGQFWLSVAAIYLVCLSWMFGTGGEAMLPYDMTDRYPATIVGVAQSVSVLSGLAIPSLCGFILGDEDTNPARWNLIFIILGCGLTFGGLVFVLVVKAKPFLPGEKVLKVATTNGQLEG